VAVLDWEMAAIAPREVDLAWMIFLHRFFEDIATVMELPGMPGFLHRSSVEARYAERSGHTPRDMDFYLTYAALRHAVVMSQVQRRAIAFGAAEMPADVDDLIMHRATLAEMLDGTYWDRVL
jgi:aminoglycoside phosphotransferase (APT) family kinase protein